MEPTAPATPATLPAPCHPGAVPDCFAIWKQLADLWLARTPVGAAEPRTSKGLAELLGVPPQNVSQWKTGSSGKAPAPWHYIMILALDLGLVVVLDPREGARLHQQPPAPQPDPGQV